MKNAALVIVVCAVFMMGLASVASAQSAYSVRNESMSAGGTTGESPNFRATTLMAEAVGTGGTSPSFGIDVVIPETIEEEPTTVRPEPRPSLHYSLGRNYPNPFNPVTTIPYSVPRKTHVAIRVFNVGGQLVRTLVDGVRNPGIVYKIVWDGTNNRGTPVASGMYFYHMMTKEYTESRKMLLLK
jgi:hypothetical protein